MNRHDRRALEKEKRTFINETNKINSQRSKSLQLIDASEYPPSPIMPIKVWRSRDFLVMLYEEHNADYPGLLRLSVIRAEVAEITHKPVWKDGIAWDELQAIKRETGFAARYAIEIYPPDMDVVNVANMRHLWLLEKPLSIGF